MCTLADVGRVDLLEMHALRLFCGLRRTGGGSEAAVDERNITKRDERVAFLFLTVILAPMLSVLIVGGYGFAVWIAQIITGPPTG